MTVEQLRSAVASCLDEAVDKVPGLSRVEAGSEGLRVGVDLVDIADVRESVLRFGDDYLSRVYTEGEIEAAGGRTTSADLLAPRLAARFAAKEAVTKALASVDAPGWWRDIEVVREPSGAPAIALTGAAAAAAELARISSWSLSMSHEPAHATAVVIAMTTPSTSTETLPRTPKEIRA